MDLVSENIIAEDLHGHARVCGESMGRLLQDALRHVLTLLAGMWRVLRMEQEEAGVQGRAA